MYQFGLKRLCGALCASATLAWISLAWAAAADSQTPAAPTAASDAKGAPATPGAADQGSAIKGNVPPAGANAPSSKYWLGVLCEPASESVRDLLRLPKDEGLIVQRIAVDGPAAKAGIRPNDLLLTANDKRLGASADLTAAVEAAKDQPFKLKLLHGGRLYQISIAPALRPEEAPNPTQSSADRQTIEQWLRQFGMNAPGAWGNGITLVHPGAGLVLPPGVNIRPELPDDMTIDIFREGKKPAQITVKRGKDTWKATEDDLSKLPNEIRGTVEPLLHEGPVRIWFRVTQSQENGSPPGQNANVPKPNAGNQQATQDGRAAPGGAAASNGTAAPNGAAGPDDGSTSDRELDDLSRRIEAMQQTLQELRQREDDLRRPAPAPSDR